MTFIDAGRQSFEARIGIEAGRAIAMARMAVDDLGDEHDDGINTWRLVGRRR